MKLNALLTLALCASCARQSPDAAAELRDSFPRLAEEILASPAPNAGALSRDGDGLFTLRGEGFLIRVREDAPGATAFWTGTADGAEEWLLTTVPADGVAARWTIEGGSLRASAQGFEVLDSAGVARLEVTAPRSYLSPNRLVATRLSAEGPVLAVHVDAPGQRALVDPAWKHTLNPSLVAREVQASVLLNDGRVLVAGGGPDSGTSWGGNGPTLSSAELYDPLTGRWTMTASPMNQARKNFSAILLRNGKALMVGGPSIVYSELFDPETNSFDAGSLAAQTAHTGHNLAMLPDGTVVVLGGLVENYNPDTNTWATMPGPAQPFGPHYLGLVQPLGPLDGQYSLLFGLGNDSVGYTNTTQIFDPLNGTWAPSTPTHVPPTGNAFNCLAGVGGRFNDGTLVAHAGSNGGVALSTDGLSWTTPNAPGNFGSAGIWVVGGMLPDGTFLSCGGSGGPYAETPGCDLMANAAATTVTRLTTTESIAGGSAVMLPSGRMMIVGGIFSQPYDDIGLTLVGLVDNTVPFVMDGGSLPLGVAGQTATLLPNGRVLLAGGANGGSTPSAVVQWYLDGGTGTASPLSLARAAHTATLLGDGRVLVAGGLTASGATASVELYDPSSDHWTAGPPLAVARSNHTATALYDGTVLVAGGLSIDGGTLKSSERFEYVDGGWLWADAGSFQTARSNHVAALLPDGRALIAAGKNGASALNSTELYDPQAGTWTNPITPLPVSVYDATATLLSSGQVLVAGGTTTPSGAESASAAVYLLDGGWQPLPGLPHARTRHAAALLSNNQLLVAGGIAASSAVLAVDVYDFEAGSWYSPAVTLRGHESATATLLPSGEVLIAGGVAPTASNEASTELFDEGRNAAPAAVPRLDPIVTSGPVQAGATLALTGSGFAGLNFGSGGKSGSPATNFPLISMERQGNEQRFFAPTTNWTGSTTDARIPAQVPRGWYWLRATVNGVTGPARPLFVGVPAGVVGADGGTPDAGGTDAGSSDAGSQDSGVNDAGSSDAGLDDGGTADAGSDDAGTADGGTGPDGGPAVDGGTGDGGVATSPGLYGCLCGSSGGSGSGVVLMGTALLLLAGRRRRATGLLAVVLLALGPLAARADPATEPGKKAEPAKKAAKAKGGDKKKAAPAAEPPKAEEPVAAPAPAPPPPPVTAPAPVNKAPKDPNGRVKVAVLPLDCGPGVQKELAEVITDAIASALASHKDLDIISSRDITARLGFERQRQLLGAASGCADNMQCMVEIGNALGVDKIAFGSVARLGNSAVLNTTVVELEGSEVVRHTERVKSISEEAFLDAIPPSIDALFPKYAAAAAAAASRPEVSQSGPTDLDGTHLGLTVRGQMAPLNLPLGAWVVHIDYSFNEAFSAGLGALIARPFGVMLRGTWVPFNASGRVRPVVALEVPMFFTPGAPAVGVGAALGVEVRIVRNLSVGAEVPLSYYFTGPAELQRFWLFGALTVTGRL